MTFNDTATDPNKQANAPEKTAVTDADVQADVGTAVADFPHLKSILPATFPGDARFSITVARMREYSDARQEKYWHQLNLPLALHAYRHSPYVKVRSLMRSLFETLDNFIVRFGCLPGTRSLVSPLWDDLWSEQPQLWSIAACVYVALCYQAAGIDVLGFETKIGSSDRDADLTVRLAGKVTHVEVEAVHRAEMGNKSDAEVRSELARRAETKASKKFRSLPAGEVGVVAEVCVVQGADVQRRVGSSVSALADWTSPVGWMPLRLVGVTHPEAPDDLRFAIMPL